MTLYTAVLVTFSAICAFMYVRTRAAPLLRTVAHGAGGHGGCSLGYSMCLLGSCSSVHLFSRCLYRRACVRVRVCEGLGVHRMCQW